MVRRLHPAPEGLAFWPTRLPLSQGRKRQHNSGQMLRKPNSQGQVFVPSSLPFRVSIWLLRKRSEESEVASHCPSGQHHRETPENLLGLELFTSSPSLELDEHQEVRFKYSVEKCAWAGRPPSRKPRFLQHLATDASSSTFKPHPCPITAKCLLSDPLEPPLLSVLRAHECSHL